jgi:hypothetical protein
LYARADAVSQTVLFPLRSWLESNIEIVARDKKRTSGREASFNTGFNRLAVLLPPIDGRVSRKQGVFNRSFELGVLLQGSGLRDLAKGWI